MEELKSDTMPQVEVIEYDPIIDSSNSTPTEWKRIAIDIEKNYFLYDGFVVIHGTDTMSYTASALSFMLEHLGKTVVLTGSMIPYGEVITDAKKHVLMAILIAANVDIPEVCIFFNNTLLRGNRAVKVSS